jgi:hypothetical protein
MVVCANIVRDTDANWFCAEKVSNKINFQTKSSLLIYIHFFV